MAKCSNCGTKLSCGCKKRTASDGTSCCVKCIKNYEKKAEIINNPTKTKYSKVGVILNVKAE